MATRPSPRTRSSDGGAGGSGSSARRAERRRRSGERDRTRREANGGDDDRPSGSRTARGRGRLRRQSSSSNADEEAEDGSGDSFVSADFGEFVEILANPVLRGASDGDGKSTAAAARALEDLWTDLAAAVAADKKRLGAMGGQSGTVADWTVATEDEAGGVWWVSIKAYGPSLTRVRGRIPFTTPITKFYLSLMTASGPAELAFSGLGKVFGLPAFAVEDGGEMSAEAASALETLLEPYHAATNMPAVLARVFSNVIFASLLSQISQPILLDYSPRLSSAECELEIVVNSMLNSTRQVQTYFLLTMHLLIALRNEAEART